MEDLALVDLAVFLALVVWVDSMDLLALVDWVDSMELLALVDLEGLVVGFTAVLALELLALVDSTTLIASMGHLVLVDLEVLDFTTATDLVVQAFTTAMDLVELDLEELDLEELALVASMVELDLAELDLAELDLAELALVAFMAELASTTTTDLVVSEAVFTSHAFKRDLNFCKNCYFRDSFLRLKGFLILNVETLLFIFVPKIIENKSTILMGLF